MILLVSLVVLLAVVALIAIIFSYVFNNKTKSFDEVMTDVQMDNYDKSSLVKKHEDSDVNRYNLTFWLGGLVMALLMVIWSMTYKTYDEVDNDNMNDRVFNEEEFEELPPQTQHQPPPPPPQVIEVVEVEDEVEVEEDLPPPEDFDAPPPPPPPPPPKKEAEPEIIVDWAAEMPQFPGGEAEMQKFIRDNIVYPQMAQEDDIQGLVVLRITVSKTGHIDKNNIEVMKPLGGGCTQAAIDVVKKMPPWSPGKQLDKPVNVRMTLPIRFQLTD